ncbi:MAG: hypothetical protein F6K48_17655 [Okeania sp. SIO3H1]|nr:hypothetical protein [Okeania sp. SIO3H1]
MKGNRKHSVPRKLSPEKQERKGGGVYPFGLSPAATPGPADRLKVTATVGALDLLSRFSSINYAKLGITTTLSDVTGTVPTGKAFAPALWIPTLGPAELVYSSGTSAFTGRNTRSANTRSGSIPFGRNTGANINDAKTGDAVASIAACDEEDMRTSLENMAAADASGGLEGGDQYVTKTFLPEEFYQISQDVTAEIGDYAPAAPVY